MPKRPHEVEGHIRIRCLGSETALDPNEHWFWSTNRIRNRYCDACRKRQDKLREIVRIHDHAEDRARRGYVVEP
jgi:hypothetical protein